MRLTRRTEEEGKAILPKLIFSPASAGRLEQDSKRSLVKFDQEGFERCLVVIVGRTVRASLLTRHLATHVAVLRGEASRHGRLLLVSDTNDMAVAAAKLSDDAINGLLRLAALGLGALLATHEEHSDAATDEGDPAIGGTVLAAEEATGPDTDVEEVVGEVVGVPKARDPAAAHGRDEDAQGNGEGEGLGDVQQPVARCGEDPSAQSFDFLGGGRHCCGCDGCCWR